MASTDTKTAETRKNRTPRKPKADPSAPQRPTVTRREYDEVILPTRLAAMKAFEKGELSQEDKNLARKAVRQARVVMKAESALVEAYETWEQAEDERKRAELEAKPKTTRKPRAKKDPAGTPKAEQVPGSPLVEVEAPELTVTETEDGGVKVEVAA